MSNYERGSEWRQWDLHIHSPASFHWYGERFGSDTKKNAALVDEMIDALNAAEPAVFALMDYWTFDGWFALQRRLKEQDAPQLKKRVFPGIELRLAAPTTCRLNAHVIFSDQLEDQALQDFRSALQVEIIARPLSEAALIELARSVGDDKLKVHGFRKSEILSDSNSALRAGAVMAEIKCDSYKSAIENVPKDQAVGFMPYDTSDGLNEVKWQEHYAYFLGLFKSSPIFETRNDDLRCAFVGEKTSGNLKWFDNFQADLGNVSRLAVSGSDAHRTVGVKGNNDKRGYGDFPSSKATWIKADPTFLGLLQAIKEPAKRSYVGIRPNKLVEVSQNKTFFIDRVEVRKNATSPIADKWLSDCDLPLNSDLIAIIGNKGSGKSALADVMALLGNSRQIQHFSFLSSKRFRAKPKDLAKYFSGQMTWCNGSQCEPMSLSDNPEPTSVELIRYIPQAHFETLCNDHVTGRSDVFEKELRAVIFAHTSPAIRQKALDFDQLIEQQESSFRDQLGELRKDLRRLNQEIEGIEAQLQPDVRRSLDELLDIKNKQIEEHNKIVPAMEPKPSDQLTPEQKEASAALEGIDRQLKELDEQERHSLSADAALAATARAVQSLRDRIRILQRQYNQFKEEAEPDLKVLGLELSKIADLTIHNQPLDDIAATLPTERQSLASKIRMWTEEKEKLLTEQLNFKAKLTAAVSAKR
jgi:hypothetical protein